MIRIAGRLRRPGVEVMDIASASSITDSTPLRFLGRSRDPDGGAHGVGIAQELDRFVHAMVAIREEIRAIENGDVDREDNVVKMAPHTAREVASSTWEHPYTREAAAYPSPEMEVRKFWSPVARVDNAYGDRNLVCSCPPLSAFEELLG